jgi:hypothetical protein
VFGKQPATPEYTQQSAQIRVPRDLLFEEARLVLLLTANLILVSAGVGLAILAQTAIPAVIVAPPAIVIGLLAWRFQRRLHRTEQSIYREAQSRPIITDGPTVVFVRDRVQTPKGHVEKDAVPVDVGLPPQEARRVLRWMKDTGETSRRKVCDATGISQGAWSKLDKALRQFGILDGNKLTDEVDYLLAQLDEL